VRQLGAPAKDLRGPPFVAVEDNHVVPTWKSRCGDGRMTHT